MRSAPAITPSSTPGSELSLGDPGWIQRASFAQMAVGTFAFAVGVYRTLDLLLGATLLAAFGAGMLVAGIHSGPHTRLSTRSAHR